MTNRIIVLSTKNFRRVCYEKRPADRSFARFSSVAVFVRFRRRSKRHHRLGCTYRKGAFTLNGVYYISDAEELRLFRDMINAHPNDGAVYSCTFYLTADIELNAPESFLYSSRGHIRAVAGGAEPSFTPASIPLTAAQLGAATAIRGFILPDAWSSPAP